MLDPTTVETVRTAVETHPNIWLSVGVAVSPVCTAALIGWVTIRFVMPAVREELAASRLHMCCMRSRRAVDETEIARKPLSSLPQGLASIASRPCVSPRLDQCEVQ